LRRKTNPTIRIHNFTSETQGTIQKFTRDLDPVGIDDDVCAAGSDGATNGFLHFRSDLRQDHFLFLFLLQLQMEKSQMKRVPFTASRFGFSE
jgi:hypothetical protein